MATGDADDIARRIAAVLPAGWFPASLDDAPVLRAALSMPGALGAWIFDTLAQVRAQARIATATGGWLDLIAFDFLGRRLRRGIAQGDDGFRTRILAEVLRERGTRAAMRRLLLDLTGREPRIIEPARPQDCGGYGIAMGYGVAGAYGSLNLPGQVFVDVYRSETAGIAGVTGYGGTIGGYGVGAIEYVSADMAASAIADDDILAAMVSNAPAGVLIWARVQS